MTDSLLLLVAFSCIGAMLGMSISRLLKLRKQYFEQFESFLQAYEVAVNFSKNTLPEVMKNFQSHSKLLKIHIDNVRTSMETK